MRSYEEILNSMVEEYEKLSHFTLHESSDVYKKLQVLSGEIYSALVNLNWLKGQMFADTATGEYLDRHALERAIERRGASKAFGEVSFTISEAALTNLVVPVGTVVSTSGENPMLFETTEEAILRAGDLKAVVPVVSMGEGKRYNVRAGAISVMVTPPTGFEKVSNGAALVGGSDVESDESLRARILESYKNASNGTNCAYYKNMALQVPGVTGAAVVPKGRGVGTVDVYIASANGAVSDEELSATQEILSQASEVNVDVEAFRANPAPVWFYVCVELEDGYEFDEVEENCRSAIEDYVSTRGVGGKFLLTEAGDRIFHIPGVREYLLTKFNNSDYICESDEYPVLDRFSVTEGIER